MNLFGKFRPLARLRKAAAVAGLALAAALPGAATAQEVLYLTPDTASSNTFSILAHTAQALTNRFGAAGTGWVDGQGSLASATPLDPSVFDGKKLVVLTTVFAQIHANQMEVLKTAITTRPDTAFVIFSDGCCQPASNLSPIVSILNDATNWGISISGQASSQISSPLNTASPYQASFSSLNPLLGSAYRNILNVPTDNALYLPQGTTIPVAAARTAAYGFFAPKSAMNGGSCTFLTADASPFGTDSGADQTRADNIINAFAKAALDADGACKQAVADVDLAVSFTGPTALGAVPQAYTLGVKNLGASASTAETTVTVTLPAGYSAQQLPAACTSLAAPANGFACTVGLLDALTGETSFSVQLVRAAGATPASSTAVVDAAPNSETVTANNTASLVFTTAADVGIDLSDLPLTGKLGTPYTGSFSCTNSGTADMANAACTVTGLPEGVQIGACTLNGAPWTSPATIPEGQSVVCQVSGTPTQDSVFPVQGTGGTNTAEANVTIGVNVPAVATPVPAVGLGGLLALSGLVGAIGISRRRKKAD